MTLLFIVKIPILKIYVDYYNGVQIKCIFKKILILLSYYLIVFMVHPAHIALLSVCLLFAGCSSDRVDTSQVEKDISVFTLDPLLWIQTKMIAWDRAKVTLASEYPLSQKEQWFFDLSNFVLGTTPISQSKLSKELNDYRGVYRTIESFSTQEVSYPLEKIHRQVYAIRDTLSDIDPDNRGYYHDNAGKYIYNLNETERKLLSRIREYKSLPFITVWGDFENFTRTYWIQDYHTKHYANTSEFQADTELKKIILDKNVDHIFIFSSIEDQHIQDMEKTYGVFIYRIPRIEEDTSAWWYIRHIEKTMNNFIQAFDTYD